MLFFNIGQAFAMALPHVAVKKAALQKLQQNKPACFYISECNSSYHKVDLINDYDDDYDDNDYDNYDAIAKEKPFVSNIFLFNSIHSTAVYSSKTFCDKIYNHVNFSRLPRFNYISLKVLRL